MSTDSITLTGLRITAHHGVFDFERRDGQEFVIDVTVWLDFRAAASGDDLARTIHYGELAVEIAEAVRRDPVDLIETLAERIADVALAHEAAERVRVTVHKPQAPIEIPFADVAVQIERVQRASPAADHGAGRRAASEGSRA
jgi:dihydroneopterin aldolase